MQILIGIYLTQGGGDASQSWVGHTLASGVAGASAGGVGVGGASGVEHIAVMASWSRRTIGMPVRRFRAASAAKSSRYIMMGRASTTGVSGFVLFMFVFIHLKIYKCIVSLGYIRMVL